MDMSRRVKVGAAVLLALLLGFVVHELPPAGQAVGAPVLGTLPYRHLQPPWWEAVHPDGPPSLRTYVVPSDVLFATDSSTIDSQGQSLLIGLSPELRGASSITVAGCTDSIGGVDSAFNVQLGRQRAQAAVGVLEAAGLSSSLFQVQSWADTHPVANLTGLDTSTINALDRRIVLIVTK